MFKLSTHHTDTLSLFTLLLFQSNKAQKAAKESQKIPRNKTQFTEEKVIVVYI